MNSNKTRYILCEDPRERGVSWPKLNPLRKAASVEETTSVPGKGRIGHNAASSQTVEVGSRKATLSPGCPFWVVSYRSPKTGRLHNPSGYTLGRNVPASRVREILTKLDEAAKSAARPLMETEATK